MNETCISCGQPTDGKVLCESCLRQRVKWADAAHAVKEYINHMAMLRTEPTLIGINEALMKYGYYIDYYFPEEHDNGT